MVSSLLGRYADYCNVVTRVLTRQYYQNINREKNKVAHTIDGDAIEVLYE
jgi:hypothetical protein